MDGWMGSLGLNRNQVKTDEFYIWVISSDFDRPVRVNGLL
jgi:hypothetical protein